MFDIGGSLKKLLGRDNADQGKKQLLPTVLQQEVSDNIASLVGRRQLPVPHRQRTFDTMGVTGIPMPQAQWGVMRVEEDGSVGPDYIDNGVNPAFPEEQIIQPLRTPVVNRKRRSIYSI